MLEVSQEPGISKKEKVFYNPHMSLNRDFTVALARCVGHGIMADAMAATGARGIRVANEAGWEADLNDFNPYAREIIRKNIGLNNVAANLHCLKVREFLSSSKWDFVDLDPFGTPAPYIEACIAATRHRGMLGICATDTSALCGTHPGAARRKYQAQPLRSDFYNEAGLRILMGFIASYAVRQGRGIEFVLCHCTRHYMRCQARLSNGPKKSVENIKFLIYCFDCMFRDYSSLSGISKKCSCGAPLSIAGPMWSGSFCDTDIISAISKGADAALYSQPGKMIGLLRILDKEQEISLPYYDLHKLCKKAKVSAPKSSYFAQMLDDAGAKYIPTHFCDTGFRTDFPSSEILALLKGIK